MPRVRLLFFTCSTIVLLGARQNSRFPGTRSPIEVKRTVRFIVPQIVPQILQKTSSKTRYNFGGFCTILWYDSRYNSFLLLMVAPARLAATTTKLAAAAVALPPPRCCCLRRRCAANAANAPLLPSYRLCRQAGRRAVT